MKIATVDELKVIRRWAVDVCDRFEPNGVRRQYGVLYRDDLDVPDECWTIRRRIVDRFDLGDALVEPVYQDFCGLIADQGAIHQHRDSDTENGIHRRYNVMVCKPYEGGVPFQDGNPIEVDEGDVWRCDASRVTHWCSKVIGMRPRIVLSYGFIVS